LPITLIQIGSFLAVVRSGSITAAAEQLGVTQPSVSSALSALSRELGVELLEPVGRSVRPSAAGLAFAPYAAAVIQQLDHGAKAAREAAAGARPVLRIMAGPTAAEHVAPLLLAAFAAAHPDVELLLAAGPPAHVLGRLAEHAVDVGLAGPAPGEEGLVAVPLAAERLVLVASPSHPAAGQPERPLRALARDRWLLPGDPLEHTEMAHALLRHQRLNPSAYSLPSNEALVRAAQAGLGIALVPRRAAASALEHGLLVSLRVRERLPTFEWLALRPEGAPRSEPAERFLAWVRGPVARAALERGEVATRDGTHALRALTGG
jgi:DNA-binding transcriptional LysR family regulator